MAAKKRSRTVATLNEHQTRQLVEMVSSGYGNNEISTRLGFSENDVKSLRERIGVETLDDARELMLTYTKQDAIDGEIATIERNKARIERGNAQKRLDAKNKAAEAAQESETVETKKVAAKKAVKFKDDDKARQKRLEESSGPKTDLLDDCYRPSKYYIGASMKPKATRGKWRLPADVEPIDFRLMLLSKGRTFVREQFNIKDLDIQREIERLALKLDFDILPR